MKKVGIVGGTGFVGGHLKNHFLSKGYEVSVYGHALFQQSIEGIKEQLGGCAVIVNLAGASIAKRWTKKQKELIYTSRIHSTRMLVDAINLLESDKKPDVLISTSAVGYYALGASMATEDAEAGDDFLAQVCKAWEAEAERVEGSVRVALCRFGVVLSASEGALPRMLTPFRMGIAATFGSGKQRFSWIHVADLASIVSFVAQNSRLRGAVNTTAPESPTYAEVAQLIRAHFKTAIRLRLPTWLMKLAMGKGHVALTGNKSAFPKKLMVEGFEFKYPSLSSALDDILASKE